MYANLNSGRQSSLSFSGVNLIGGAGKVLEKTIKSKQLEEYKTLMNSLKNNSIDTNIFGRYNSSTKLDARVISPVDSIRNQEYSQRIFESTIHFLKRVSKKAEAMQTKVKSLVNPKDIYNF